MNDKALYNPTLWLKENMECIYIIEEIIQKGFTDKYLNIYSSKELLSANWPQILVSGVGRGSRSASRNFGKVGFIRPAQMEVPQSISKFQFNINAELPSLKNFQRKIDSVIQEYPNEKFATHIFNLVATFKVTYVKELYIYN